MSRGRSNDAGTSARTPGSWIVLAHMLGAAGIVGLDGFRLATGVGLAVLPIAAVTGLIAGLIIAGIERAVDGRPWWQVGVALAAPALIVTLPVSHSLFQGAYAQTLPLASAMPFVLPVVLWLAIAVAIVVGRRILRNGDLTTRGIMVLALAGVIGAVVWAERHVLGTGYPTAHIGATLAACVLAGVAVRVTRRSGVPIVLTGMLGFVALGTAAAACVIGLRTMEHRARLATFGDQSRDLVTLWRKIFDFDRDGSAAVLGGGDCNDRDRTLHPGAVDVPGDGIDQDCDGLDPMLITPIETDVKSTQHDLDAWKESPEVAAILGKTKGMNVVLITVDALRADILAPDAANRDDFPMLTKLLADSVWFTRAFSPASGTDISLSTLLSGRHDPFQPLSATLPEMLQESGMTTFGALPNEVLRYAGETMLHRGMNKVAIVYTDWEAKDVGDHVSANVTTKEGLRAIGDAAAQGKTAFIWMHYFDVHEHHQIKVPDAMLSLVHPGVAPKEHNYRALLRGIDTEIGRVLTELDAKGLADKTIVVFASDHGESLGEDKRLLDTHGKVTYAPLVRIPLAFRIPGVAPGQRLEQVSLVDVAPTLLSLLAIPDQASLDGKDLVPTLLGAPRELRDADHPIAIHEELQWSLVDWPYQLIVRPADNIVELYDLEKDPQQKTDIASQFESIVTRMKAHYAAFPQVVVDRTPNGRYVREQRARQRPRRGP
jgi:arylsulfatase A-like enzyme